MREPITNPPAIVKTAEDRLDAIARLINDRESKTTRDFLEHHVRQGRDLIRAKEMLGKRKFAPWLQKNFKFSRRTAYTYIMLAENGEFICEAASQISSVCEAVEIIAQYRRDVKRAERGLPPLDVDDCLDIDPPMDAEIKDMEEGRWDWDDAYREDKPAEERPDPDAKSARPTRPAPRKGPRYHADLPDDAAPEEEDETADEAAEDGPRTPDDRVDEGDPATEEVREEEADDNDDASAGPPPERRTRDQVERIAQGLLHEMTRTMDKLVELLRENPKEKIIAKRDAQRLSRDIQKLLDGLGEPGKK
jgi:hypothetical protein